jgi:uncharacterized membrane protein HdeD (DUF308 family)
MKPESFLEKKEESIAQHIFSVSAAMVGVCLTVIGIINIIAEFNKTKSITDDIIVFDALFFLISCLLSYTAIKTKNRVKRLRIEKIADLFFLLALIVMVFVCSILVYCFNFNFRS